MYISTHAPFSAFGSSSFRKICSYFSVFVSSMLKKTSSSSSIYVSLSFTRLSSNLPFNCLAGLALACEVVILPKANRDVRIASYP